MGSRGARDAAAPRPRSPAQCGWMSIPTPPTAATEPVPPARGEGDRARGCWDRPPLPLPESPGRDRGSHRPGAGAAPCHRSPQAGSGVPRPPAPGPAGPGPPSGAHEAAGPCPRPPPGLHPLLPGDGLPARCHGSPADLHSTSPPSRLLSSVNRVMLFLSVRCYYSPHYSVLLLHDMLMWATVPYPACAGAPAPSGPRAP